MKRSLILFLLTLTTLYLSAQKVDKTLEKKVRELITGFNGEIGIYLHNLRNNKVVTINADSSFPTASIVKVPILIGIMDKMNKGELNYHQSLTYKDSLLYEGVDILGSFKNNEKIELSKVLMLMLTTSDNTASLWLQGLAGTGTRINQLMDSLGYTATRVNSRTPGREENRKQFGWGQTTPRDMARVFHDMTRGTLLGDSTSNRMLKLLSRNYWDEEALSQIPAGIFVASKNGAVDASRSEVIYVNGPGVSYIFSVFTKNNADKSWGDKNEAWVLTKKLSQLVWNHFKQ
jgi:beta-lactamase class A